MIAKHHPLIEEALYASDRLDVPPYGWESYLEVVEQAAKNPTGMPIAWKRDALEILGLNVAKLRDSSSFGDRREILSGSQIAAGFCVDKLVEMGERQKP